MLKIVFCIIFIYQDLSEEYLRCFDGSITSIGSIPDREPARITLRDSIEKHLEEVFETKHEQNRVSFYSHFIFNLKMIVSPNILFNFRLVNGWG